MDSVTLVFEMDGAAGADGAFAVEAVAEVGPAAAVDAALLVGAAACVAAALDVAAAAAALVLVALLPLPDEHAVALSRQPAITSAARERRRIERSGRVERTIAFSLVESIR